MMKYSEPTRISKVLKNSLLQQGSKKKNSKKFVIILRPLMTTRGKKPGKAMQKWGWKQCVLPKSVSWKNRSILDLSLAGQDKLTVVIQKNSSRLLRNHEKLWRKNYMIKKVIRKKLLWVLQKSTLRA